MAGAWGSHNYAGVVRESIEDELFGLRAMNLSTLCVCIQTRLSPNELSSRSGDIFCQCSAYVCQILVGGSLDYVVCVLKLATMIMGCCFYPFIFEVWKAINHPFGCIKNEQWKRLVSHL